MIDLKSFSGTFVDNVKLVPYIPRIVRIGAPIRFGDSTRKYVIAIDDDGLELNEEITVEKLNPKKKQK